MCYHDDCFFIGRVLCRSTSSSWEHKIRADLLENYDKKVRPAIRGKKPVEVSFALRVGRLVKVVTMNISSFNKSTTIFHGLFFLTAIPKMMLKCSKLKWNLEPQASSFSFRSHGLYSCISTITRRPTSARARNRLVVVKNRFASFLKGGSFLFCLCDRI